MTSAVTSMPRAFAQRMTSTDPAVETWQTCRRAPTCSASSTSRAMIDSSATAGQPARPSSPDSAPSFIWAPSVSRGSCACWAITPSKVLTYSSARRMSSGSETQNAVVGEDAHVRARPRHRADLGELLALEADGDGADRAHGGVAVLRRRGDATCSTTPAVSATGEVFAIAKTAVKPPAAAARGAGEHGLALLVARLAQVGVQVDEAGQRDEPVGVDRPSRPRQPRCRRPRR